MNNTSSASSLVSVIINCFNGETYLVEAVESLLNQSYQHWELVFWDNQSTDQSAAIIRSFDDSRIRYFYAKEHTGLGKARSLALEKAKGEWIGFLDVDDLWFENKLSRQIEEIHKIDDRTGMIYCRCEYFRNRKKSGGITCRETKICPSCEKLPQENLLDELYMGNFIPFPSVLYKKEALDAIGGIPPYKHPPDYYMSLAISSRFGAIAVDEVLCGYRLHSSNLSRSIKEDGYREPIDIVRKVAPEDQCSQLIRCNVIRYVFYLLRQKRLFDALKEINSIGTVGFIFGVLKLVSYRMRYSCGL